ncbi:lysosomal acid glucosylceramidase-like, partial [Rhipicephalus sanguineus]|uniref:lysosomal acid glucosylceramidase-like n=1 Tax=Rhipicephalus sanguineus TaxID=34632 RepID=UPI0020C31056
MSRISVPAQCQPRDYGRGSIVCVCNATYCDFIGDIGLLPSGAALAFESSKAGHRFTKTTLPFGEKSVEHEIQRNISTENGALLLVVDSSRKYQKVFGFGGAFTDAAGINIKSLPTNMQDDILKSYYTKQGLAYTIGRIPMASCDFSVRKYTYDDTPGDFELKNFTIAPEDFYLKIPYIKAAMSISSEPIWFFGSSWSSPSWMKTSNTVVGRGTLKGEPGGPYYKAWAKYYVRFVQEYERHGIPIWGLTAENEPTMGFLPGFPGQALGFTPKTQRDFVKLDLGPALDEAGYGADKLQLMIFDDNRIFLPHWADVVLGDPEAAKYVHGVAVHWYTDNFIGPWVLDKVHQAFPDKFILATEACAGFGPIVKDRVILGSWERAERYASDILQDLNHWASGWTDWNIALDTEGGPNWLRNFADSPVIVNATAREFYKQPTYYALAHV